METTRSVETTPPPVQWVLLDSDIVDASRARQRRLWLRLRVASICLFILSGLALAARVDAIVWLPLIALGIYLILFQLVLFPRSVRRRMRTLIGQTVVMRVDRDGIHVDRAGSHQWTEWQAVEGVVESPTSIVILRQGFGAGAIPKRAFPKPVDADAFVAYVRAHTGTDLDASHRPTPPAAS